MSRKRIYLDYATTTPLDPLVEREMKPYWSREFGNPGSLHREGARAARALTKSRTRVARVLEAHPHEIIFTSGGTESNNLAIRGVLEKIKDQKLKIKNQEGPHIITTTIEHSSVLEPIRALEREGISVTYVPVDREGILDLNQLKKSLRPETVLVSIQHANNEIGTIQPIRKISNLIRTFSQDSRGKLARPIFHVDACQSPLYLSVNQNTLGADLITLDAHKLYGPKGVGALYVRDKTPLASSVYGGGQERGMRAGTENIPLIVGFAKALELSAARREKETKRLTKLRDYFFSELAVHIPHAVVNGSVEHRLPNNINISLPGRDTEFLVLELDAKGIACSTKSACLENERESYVVKALGRHDGSEKSSIRFTLGRDTTKADISYTVAVLKRILCLN